ncbi:hypothetical protein KOI35_46275 [Actinoplanes bogorensis]|uniref:Clp R domain-containing protein n=1 Tax=Paractinoplanes bogorensis TaxID=1610840 RepID=A0ABS5Z5G4_9ACTN|nr:Clp protease N-terminal domain-containing protein [Actinoplanes bogorensis]MBU2670930.1 hypothetical protein [Actinoplanes bogorensis]
MANEFAVGDRLTNTLARARGAAGGGPIGTGHLLFALAGDKDVAPRLDPFEITPVVVWAVLATPGRATADEASDDSARGADDRVLAVTANAAAALRGVTDDSRAALLDRLLDDPGAEASAVIRDCGVDLTAVRENLAPQPDRLAPDLRPARDALIGRVRYRGRGLKDRLLFSVLARQINHGDRAVTWTRLEADERARTAGRSTRTDDILLALLVTHEVARAYPHLSGGGTYGGGEGLLARGITSERVRAAALDDRRDDVPPGKILVPGPDWTEDTQVLLDRLTAHPGNRATRLLAQLS